MSTMEETPSKAACQLAVALGSATFKLDEADEVSNHASVSFTSNAEHSNISNDDEDTEPQPLGRGWTVSSSEIADEDGRKRTVVEHRNPYVGLELILDPIAAPDPPSAAAAAVLLAPEFNPPWVKFWDADGDAVRYMNVDTGEICWTQRNMEMTAALAAAPEPHEPWVKMYSATRGAVLYHNPETRMTVPDLEDARVADRIEGTPDPPEGWEKCWNADLQAVTYRRDCTASTALNLYQIEVEETAVAAAPNVDAPWEKRYDSREEKVYFLNTVSQKKAFSLDDVARIDMLDELPDPPAPWVKEVGESWYAVDSPQSNLLLDDEDDEHVDDNTKILQRGRKPIMVWYRHPDRGTKALDLSDIQALDALANAPDAGPSWSKSWNPVTQSVEYLKAGMVKSVTSLKRTREIDALEAAPSIGHGWEKAWDESSEKVYYYHNDSRKTVWSAGEAKAEATLSQAASPPQGSLWFKSLDSQNETVVYRHKLDSSRQALYSIDAVLAQDTLDKAPNVMGWLKVWSNELNKVIYQNTGSGFVVSSYADACLASAPVPPAGSGWSKTWSAEQSCVVYVNGISGNVTSDFKKVCISAAIESAPNAGRGWSKLWDAVSSSVVYLNDQSKALASTLNDVKRIDALEAMPDPGPSWTKEFDMETETGFYLNINTCIRADTLKEVQFENERQLLAAAPNASSLKWTKRWSREKNAVEYVNEKDGYIVVDSIEATATVDSAKTPSLPWVKHFDVDCGTVIYRHGITGEIAQSFEAVVVANELAMAPNPGPKWEKRWCAESGEVHFQHRESGSIARSIGEVDEENKRIALLEAHDPGVPWKKGWSYASCQVYYHNPITGCRAWSIAEVAEANAVADAPSVGDWNKSWSKATDSVVYTDPDTGVQASTAEAARALESLKTIPNAGPNWEKVWSRKHSCGLYRHVVTKKKVASISEARAYEQSMSERDLTAEVFAREQVVDKR